MKFGILLICFLMVPLGCSKHNPKTEPRKHQKQFVTTTVLLKEIVSNVTKDSVHITVLIPNQTDPHLYSPTPNDIQKIAKADFILLNGLGLEGSFQKTIVENAKGIIYSFGDSVLSTSEDNLREDDIELHQEHKEHSHQDPHFWFDPLFVHHGLQKLVGFLADQFPNCRDYFYQNGNAYLDSLFRVHTTIQSYVSKVPVSKRLIVSDHFQFSYFCKRYGFKEVGAIVPSLHTHSAPSSRELGRLSQLIREQKIEVLFVDRFSQSTVAQQFANDLQIRMIPLQTFSLGEKGSGTETYIQFLWWNAKQICDALMEK